MGKEKPSVVVMGDENPLTMLKSNYKDFETHCKKWLSKNSLLIETAMVTATGAAEGAACSVLYDIVTHSICSAFTAPPPTVVSLKVNTCMCI